MQDRAPMLDDLRGHIGEKLASLEGDWVHKNSGYEQGICEALEMVRDKKQRYWDARWGNYFLEFKKGKSIWLDLVRYSEVLLRTSERARRRTYCLFFVPDAAGWAGRRIEEVVCVDSRELIVKLELTEEQALALLGLKASVPRSLNAQASLTPKDVRQIAVFAVPSRG